MEKAVDFSTMYNLQDLFLQVVFSLQNNFYLTGGTALHRFYYKLRYSDDLDFFTHNDMLFGESINEIMDNLKNKNLRYKRIVQSKDFQRLQFEDMLQVDFVNDMTYREGKSVLFGNFRIDNKMNILANKVGAIVHRDEEKDVFDLVALAAHEAFSWDSVFTITNKKCNVDRATVIHRLLTFPLEWLENIKTISPFTITRQMIEILCDDIKNNRYNSLHSLHQ